MHSSLYFAIFLHLQDFSRAAPTLWNFLPCLGLTYLQKVSAKLKFTSSLMPAHHPFSCVDFNYHPLQVIPPRQGAGLSIPHASLFSPRSCSPVTASLIIAPSSPGGAAASVAPYWHQWRQGRLVRWSSFSLPWSHLRFLLFSGPRKNRNIIVSSQMQSVLSTKSDGRETDHNLLPRYRRDRSLPEPCPMSNVRGQRIL